MTCSQTPLEASFGIIMAESRIASRMAVRKEDDLMLE